MKAGQRQSDNVEVECFGQVANLRSPEAEAVNRCLEEVTALSKAALGHPQSINELRDRQNDFAGAKSTFMFHQNVERRKRAEAGLEEGVLDLGETIEAFKQELPDLLKGTAENRLAQKARTELENQSQSERAR